MLSTRRGREGALTTPTPQRFQFRGDLAETTLPEILFSVDRFQVPGIIEASRGEVVKKVYIKGGTVVHASSTDLDDSLGSFLLRNRRLTPEQYRTSMRERRNSSHRYGVLLIELGFLSPADVYEAIREQIEAIVWSLFAWREGVVTFAIGEYEPAGTVSIQLPMRQVILRGIQRAPDPKPLVARLGPKETVFEPCYHTESLIESALDAEVYELLRKVDGKSSLYEVCRGGPYSVAENAKLMYAFQIMKLVRKVTVAKPDSGRESGSGGSEARGAEDRQGAEAARERREGTRDRRESGQSSGAVKIRLDTPGGRYGE